MKENKFDLLLPQSARSLSYLTTLPSLSKIRTSSLLTWKSNSSKVLQSIPQPITEMIRKRNKTSQEVTPIAVSEVLHRYFIPMLEAQRRRKLSLSTVSPRVPSQSLCEFLNDELVESYRILDRMNAELMASKLDKQHKLQEIEDLKMKLMNKSVELGCSKMGLYQTSLTKLKIPEKNHMKEYLLANRKKREITELLYIESNLNSRMKDQANTLEHWNSLFAMQSDNMGERLKGLYFSCTNLCGNNLETYLKSKVLTMFGLTRELESQHTLHCDLLDISLKVISNCIRNSSNIIEEKKRIEEDVKKIKIKLKDNNDKYTSDIVKASDEKETLDNNLNNISKKMVEFDNEYEKMLIKIRELKSKNKHLGDKEEKICKYCKKVFIEKENFNWSCRVHSSEWSGKSYWCCGESKKDGLGCRTSKHISAGEEEGLTEENVKLKQKKNSSGMCNNCREAGHTYDVCPKDPNPRTRIQLKTKKKKLTNSEVANLQLLAKFKKVKYLEPVDGDGFEEIANLRKRITINSEFMTPRFE